MNIVLDTIKLIFFDIPISILFFSFLYVVGSLEALFFYAKLLIKRLKGDESWKEDLKYAREERERISCGYHLHRVF